MFFKFYILHNSSQMNSFEYYLMKKIISICMLLVFLISQSGIAIAMHWCGGHITSVKFFPAHKHHCPCGKKAMKSNCCKDKSTTFKIKNDLTKAAQQGIKIPSPQPGLILVCSQAFATITQNHLPQYGDYSPPKWRSCVPIHLLNGVFLI